MKPLINLFFKNLFVILLILFVPFLINFGYIYFQKSVFSNKDLVFYTGYIHHIEHRNIYWLNNSYYKELLLKIILDLENSGRLSNNNLYRYYDIFDFFPKRLSDWHQSAQYASYEFVKDKQNLLVCIKDNKKNNFAEIIYENNNLIFIETNKNIYTINNFYFYKHEKLILKDYNFECFSKNNVNSFLSTNKIIFSLFIAFSSLYLKKFNFLNDTILNVLEN